MESNIYKQFQSFHTQAKMLKRFRDDYPKFKYLFQFDEFNEVQKQCYPKIFNHSQNMIVSAPTSSGKTVLFQLLIAKLMNERKTKCLYLAPIKSLCHEKSNSWRKKFMSTMQVMELTGDTLEMQPGEFGNADIYVATPEKIDYISRKNLNFLKQLNLLLIDEIHMLNMEDRGAILQAIVSRIMSINKKIRIMAVSATIPNIKEVAQWLKVPQHLICVFGEQYRPAKLHKVVLGFKPANNDFNFQKMLNFKILDIIRQYSFGRGTLIFCQTQKGTQEACNKLVQQAHERQFVPNEQLAMQLINSSRMVDNHSLKSLLPHGVAFHNASLSMKDRSIVQGLFLDTKVKVLCTTSTLAMGINLPARLVIIKSTKCYKGSGKGYQQYTQIELDQMMGRAGRMPFDKEGTVVMMTETSNYKKYMGDNKLQNLESQLYNQLIDHLNTEISLHSIQSLSEAIEYFKNSFCYIRMQNSPKLYNLMNKNEIEKFVTDTCLKLTKKLAEFEIVQYVQMNEKIFPKQCSNNISKNAIEVETIVRIIEQLNQVKSQREFLNILCQANELTKYRSKLDERKCLKELNEKNRYTLKQAISTSQKKCFVLIQAQLSGIYIDNWELRKQANQMLYFFKRLAYCVKCLALERKHSGKTFWLYLFGCLFHKYFFQSFWETNEEKVLKQIKKVASKWKNIQARGIRNLTDLTYGLSKLDIFGNGMSSAHIKKGIEQQIQLLNSSLQISFRKAQETLKQNQIQRPSAFNQSKQPNHMLKFIFTQNFDEKFKSITVIIEHNGSIYLSGYLNQNNLEFSAFLKNTSSQKYFIAVVKDGYVGFDEFYWFQFGTLKKTELKKEENEKKMVKGTSVDSMNQKRKSSQLENNNQDSNETSQPKRKSNSLSSSLKRIPKTKMTNKPGKDIPRNISFVSPFDNSNEQNISNSFKIGFNDDAFESQHYQLNSKQNLYDEEPQPLSSTMKINKRSKQLKLTSNFNTIKRKYTHDEQYQQKLLESNPLKKQLKRSTEYRDLKSYNWKPGFEEIKGSYNPDEEITTVQPKRLLLLNENEDEQETQKKSNHNVSTSNNANVIEKLNEYMEENYQHHLAKKMPINKNLTNKFSLGHKNLQKDTNIEAKTYHPEIKLKPNIFNESKFQSAPNQAESNKFYGKNQFNQFKKQKALVQQKKVFGLNNVSSNSFLFEKRTDPFEISKEEKKRLPTKIFFEDLNNPIAVPKQKLQNQPPKKFKNAYEYFQSFLADDQD